MRIKINLTAGNDVSIPIEYNYNVYLNLRKALLGYVQFNKPKHFNKYKKNFPGFTFSQLMIPERLVETGFIQVKGNFLALFVSSTDDVFMEYLVKAINSEKEFSIYRHRFKLKKIEVLEEPEFISPMRFKMLSPLLLMTGENDKVRFVRPGDSDLNKIFAEQLLKAYNQMNDSNYRPESIRMIPDQDYIERKRKLTKLFTIRDINYKAIFCPFSLSGEIDLIRFAYRNGIGAKTNYGFGMIETTGASTS